MLALRLLSRTRGNISLLKILRSSLSAPSAFSPLGPKTYRNWHHAKQSTPNLDTPEPQYERNTSDSNTNGSTSWNFSPYMMGLLAVGLGLTAYGLYGFFGIMTMWPVDIRQDLRRGLLAKRQGDLDIAAQYLLRAWERSKTIALHEFGKEPLLKTTGLATALAAVLEQQQKFEDAYSIYQDALGQLSAGRLDMPTPALYQTLDVGAESLKDRSGAEKMRSVALAYKLSELAHKLKKDPAEEEKWLVWAVEMILRTVLKTSPMTATEVGTAVQPSDITHGPGPNVRVLAEQMGLPSWIIEHDIAAPFEALASFYAKHGKLEFALPLYLQAISILIPPPPNVSMVEDKCRGAQLMGNVAEILLRNYTRSNINSETISQAESWAKKGLDIVTHTRKVSLHRPRVCEEAYAVLLYNVAMIRDLAGDVPRARALLTESLEQSKAIRMEEGIRHAKDALESLDSGSGEIKPLVVGTEEEIE